MPPRIVVPRLQPALQRVVPEPVQRRVIALELHAPAGAGMADFCYTPQLGNRLWLYGIDLWVYCMTPPAQVGGFYYLMYGSGIPLGGDEVATRWNFIIPLSCGLKLGFRWLECDSFHRHFSMAKLFTTNELRLAVAVENGVAHAWEMTVAFEIAEG